MLQELKDLFDSLPRDVQRDIKLVELPMECAVENSLIVNAIQRASNVIVQCSLKEGFGLTATEAMLKRVCFVGTSACGLRTQVRHLQDGYLVQGDQADYRNVARALNAVLGHDRLRKSLALNGQKRASDRFLVHSQMEQVRARARACRRQAVGRGARACPALSPQPDSTPGGTALAASASAPKRARVRRVRLLRHCPTLYRAPPPTSTPASAALAVDPLLADGDGPHAPAHPPHAERPRRHVAAGGRPRGHGWRRRRPPPPRRLAPP